jgi:hypothetical protein
MYENLKNLIQTLCQFACRGLFSWPGNALALAEHRDWTVIVHSRG